MVRHCRQTGDAASAQFIIRSPAIRCNEWFLQLGKRREINLEINNYTAVSFVSGKQAR
jgi:hypothetical protein